MFKLSVRALISFIVITLINIVGVSPAHAQTPPDTTVVETTTTVPETTTTVPETTTTVPETTTTVPETTTTGPQQAPPKGAIDISSQCVNIGPPRVDVWRLDLRYPASESPVTIRFRDGATGPILLEREFVTPGNYRDIVLGADTLVAVRVVNGQELDRAFHRADFAVTCKNPPPPGVPFGFPPPVTPTPPLPPLEEVFIGAAGSTCQRDIPVIVINFGNIEAFNGVTGTLTFLDVNGQVIEVRPITYVVGGTVLELYPGATIDPVTGEATDWPGWMLNEFGFWVEDPTDAIWRDGLTLVVEINPTASAQVTYPPASSACANPPGNAPPFELPPAL